MEMEEVGRAVIKDGEAGDGGGGEDSGGDGKGGEGAYVD